MYYVCYKHLFKGRCHHCEVIILYLEKDRAGENIACKDYVRWQVWTLGPLNRQVKVYHVPFKAKFKCSWQAVEIGTGKQMIAKWFAMTTNYLPVIYWKQYFQQYTWSLSEWVQNQGHTFTLRHCSCFPGLRSSTICPLSAGGMGVTTPSLNWFPIMGLNLWRPCFHLDCIFLKTIEGTSVIVTKGKGPQGPMFLKLIIGDKTLITHWVRISRCPWGYLGIMDVLGKCRQGSNSNV